MRLPSPAARRKARLEIIPLIDIVFFLLATFVMVSLSMVKNQGIGVQLPKADTGTRQSAEKGQLIVISVDRNGDIFVNKKKTEPAKLKAELETLKKKENDPAILLNGDENALLGKAIFVLDEARKLGIKKFAIGTKQN